jgi:GTP-binding protein Era
MKFGYVNILGRANAGKSTLLNAIVGEKLAITTPRPQTTRTYIKGIVTRENSQIVFVDTPGYHAPKNELGKAMIGQIEKTTGDVSIYIVDSDKNKFNIDEQIIGKLRNLSEKSIIVLNKIDSIPKTKILELIQKYSKFNFSAIIPISAKKNDGVDVLLEEIEKLLPEGEKFYSDEEFTTQTVRQMIEEYIRESVFYSLSDEVPFGTNVMIESYKESEKRVAISANIICERESHKGIIIGEHGRVITKIKEHSKPMIEDLLGKKVSLDLWVKHKDNWRNDKNIVKIWGFDT